VFERGIMKKRLALNGNGQLEVVNAPPLFFPTCCASIIAGKHYLQYRVPEDDHHTLFFEVYLIESKRLLAGGATRNPPVEYASLPQDR